MLYIKSLPRYTFSWMHVFAFMAITMWALPLVVSSMYGTAGVIVMLPKTLVLFFIVSFGLTYCMKRVVDTRRTEKLLSVCLQVTGAHVMIAIAFIDLFPTAGASVYLVTLSLALLMFALAELGLISKR